MSSPREDVVELRQDIQSLRDLDVEGCDNNQLIARVCSRFETILNCIENLASDVGDLEHRLDRLERRGGRS